MIILSPSQLSTLYCNYRVGCY